MQLENLVTYKFILTSALNAAQEKKVVLLETTPPLPTSFSNYRRLYGYVQNGDLVSWAWGSILGKVGELAVKVDDLHQGRTLGKRLILRYLLERNPTIDRFEFDVINKDLIPLLAS